MPRRKHEKTEYEKLRRKYRKACSRHVVTFEVCMTEDQKRHTFAYADGLRKLGNSVVAEMNKRIEQLFRTKAYRALQKDYSWHTEHLKNLDPESERAIQLEKERNKIAASMGEMQKKYGVTAASVCSLTQEKWKDYGVGSILAQARGEDIWEACERVLYGNGRRLHFRKRGDLPIIRAKQAKSGIPIKLDENGDLLFSLNGVGKFTAAMPEKDRFLMDEYKALCSYMASSDPEKDAVLHVEKTGEILPVFRPCYAALKCEQIRGKLRVYIQVTVAAPPMKKYTANGEPRHDFSRTGRVGCDNGSQSFSAVSKDTVILENTAERGNHSTKDKEYLVRKRQKKMARSLRKTNPERYNRNGTFKKGSRGRWKKSKHYRRLQYLVREQQRRDAASRLYSVRESANMLRALGDELIIEPSNAKALQRRSKKPAEKSGRTIEVPQKDGSVKTVAKNKRKKRFGRSILHRCPGAFQAELKKKFGDGYHEVARNFRASQYDHVRDDYVKKKLSQRWHHLPDKKNIQRDIYSGFLLSCSNDEYTAPDRKKCIAAFDNFYALHEDLIKDIKVNHRKICNSGISV